MDYNLYISRLALTLINENLLCDYFLWLGNLDLYHYQLLTFCRYKLSKYRSEYFTIILK